MSIKIPSSTLQHLIFPYVELSNGYAYAHHKELALAHGFSKHFLDQFFVTLHKTTAVDLNRIMEQTKIIGYIYPFLALILIGFGALMGIFYHSKKYSFIFQLSAGIIVATSVLFLVWLIIHEIRLLKMRKALFIKLRSVVKEANADIEIRAEIIIPEKLEFPYWLEIKFENPLPEPITALATPSIQPGSPYSESVHLLPSAKYLAPPDMGNSYKTQAQSAEMSKELAMEEVKLVIH